MKRILFCFVIFGLVLSLASCGDQPTAYELAESFREQYGMGGTLFSPEVPEGEGGFVRDGFFESLYGDYYVSVSDFAVILYSDGEHISECAVLIAASPYDALILSDALYRRLELIRSVSEDDASLDGAFVRRKGTVAVMCAVLDNQRADLIWKKLM